MRGTQFLCVLKTYDEMSLLRLCQILAWNMSMATAADLQVVKGHAAFTVPLYMFSKDNKVSPMPGHCVSHVWAGWWRFFLDLATCTAFVRFGA